MVGGAHLFFLGALIVVVLVLSWSDAMRRALSIAFVAILLIFLALRELPLLLPGDRLLGEHWNWSGELLAFLGVLGVAQILVARAGFSWQELGVTLRQRAGSWWPGLLVLLAVVGANLLLLLTFATFRLQHVPAETWLYQATMPGLVEETVFRGVLLALAERLIAPRWSVGGARLGWGGVLVTLVFVGLHGFSAHVLTGVLPAALLYLWLRARTGSLVLPIVAHNTWNLSVYFAHL
ncbi:MAG: CPBP family intramembrane metalloprotease [Burkholderiales bacterium]|nr:CPBP family intramembrane metalloprotease [Burkholderiales bacterium]